LTPAGVVVAKWADRLLDVAQYVDAGQASLHRKGALRDADLRCTRVSMTISTEP
jgi:hypothetical protein